MKKALLISGAGLIVLLLLFTLTDPADVPSFILPVPFLLIFIVLQSLASMLLQGRGLSTQRSWRIGALCAAVPLTLLVLQSIGQLTLRDLLTIAALFALSYFYIARTTATS